MLNIKFFNKTHKERFFQLLTKDNTNEYDIERYSLFYILAGNNDIYSKGIDNIYDFKNHGIRPSKIKKIDLCSSSKSLMDLAIDLYNGNGKKAPSDIFLYLDTKNTKLALNAIEMRYA